MRGNPDRNTSHSRGIASHVSADKLRDFTAAAKLHGLQPVRQAPCKLTERINRLSSARTVAQIVRISSGQHHDVSSVELYPLVAKQMRKHVPLSGSET